MEAHVVLLLTHKNLYNHLQYRVLSLSLCHSLYAALSLAALA